VPPSQDLALVEISADDGQTWALLRDFSGGESLRRAKGNRDIQPSAEWQNPIWQTVELGLADYATAENLRLRFRLEADQVLADKGWLIDNLMIISGTQRQADLGLELLSEPLLPIEAGEPLMLRFQLSNQGPDIVAADLSSQFSTLAIQKIELGANCRQKDGVLCYINALTHSQILDLRLWTRPQFSGTLSISSAIKAAGPYVEDSQTENNQWFSQVQILARKPRTYLPLLWK
jgi:hypothetical protein